jgi:putative ABC transport system permease protein
MTFLALALRNLVRRPMRACLAASGVALAVASFIALVGIARGHAHAWERSLTASGTDVLVSRKGGVELLSTSIDEAVGERLARLDGVAGVGGELLDLVELSSGQNILVSGRRRDSYLWTSLQMLEGHLPASDTGSEAALGQSLADALRLHAGARLTVDGRDLVVTGVVRAGGAMMSHMLYMPLPEMQRLVRRPGVVTIFNVQLRPPLDPYRSEAFLRAASREFPNLTFTATESIQDENPVLQMASALAWSVSIIALVMGLVGVVNTLLMSVTERIREIGILAAVGWPPSRVLALIVCEGLLLASIGGVVGIAGGYLALRVLVASPHVAGLLEPEFTIRAAVEVIVATVLLGGIGGLYPAWRATQMPAVQALKHE